MIAWAIVSVVLGSLIVFGQGGTGRAPANTNAPKKAPARKSPTRRTSNTNQSNEPASQTESQPVGTSTAIPTPAPTPAGPPEPTLDQTMNWLGASLTDRSFFTGLALGANNYVDIDGMDYHLDGEPQPQGAFSADRCTLTLVGKEYTFDNGVRDFAQATIVIPFADIDPALVEDCSVMGPYSGAQCLRMRTANSRKTITGSTIYAEKYVQMRGGNKMKSETSISLLFRDSAGQDRAKKAIKHAVSLCGGKASPF